MKAKILADFQICISAPLGKFIFPKFVGNLFFTAFLSRRLESK